jgi:type IV pilus assembly protein PilC
MIYPIVVAAMSIVTVLVSAVYVLPKFEDFFKDLDAELPLPTRMLLGDRLPRQTGGGRS